jgi:protein SCO1/2
MNLGPLFTLTRARARSLALAGLLLILATGSSGCRRAAPASPPAEIGDCCLTTDATDRDAQSVKAVALDPIHLPASRLMDETGRPVDLSRDLVGTRVAAIQFIFTRCATICPILANQFEGVRTQLADGMGRDYALVSITVDPEYDRPDTLKEWGRRHGVGAGWSLLTGTKVEVERLLAGLGVSTSDPRNHQSRVLVFDGATGQGLWTGGLASAGEIATILRRVRSAREAATPDARGETAGKDKASPAGQDAASERYFTNTPLVDHRGRSHQFYRDLLRGKVVVINVFFSECKGSCVAMGNTLARIQDRLGDRLEREVRLLSITVDSARDTNDVLAGYARRYGAGEGWYFLSGQKSDVDTLLKKLGQYVENRESHGAVMLVGNLRTGLWKKVFGLADAEEVLDQVQSVIDDKGTG